MNSEAPSATKNKENCSKQQQHQQTKKFTTQVVIIFIISYFVPFQKIIYDDHDDGNVAIIKQYFFSLS
jgi:hypothetical protein